MTNSAIGKLWTILSGKRRAERAEAERVTATEARRRAAEEAEAKRRAAEEAQAKRRAAGESEPKPAASARPTNVVEEAKDIIRESSGARDFLSQATQAGWSKIKEDFIGIYLKKGNATLIFGVLPSHGPDTIWNAMMTTEDTGTVYLVTEGKVVDDKPQRNPAQQTPPQPAPRAESKVRECSVLITGQLSSNNEGDRQNIIRALEALDAAFPGKMSPANVKMAFNNYANGEPSDFDLQLVSLAVTEADAARMRDFLIGALKREGMKV